jgi:hypothetical protein
MAFEGRALRHEIAESQPRRSRRNRRSAGSSVRPIARSHASMASTVRPSRRKTRSGGAATSAVANDRAATAPLWERGRETAETGHGVDSPPGPDTRRPSRGTGGTKHAEDRLRPPSAGGVSIPAFTRMAFEQRRFRQAYSVHAARRSAPTAIRARVVRRAGHMAHLLGRECVDAGLHADGVRRRRIRQECREVQPRRSSRNRRMAGSSVRPMARS